MLPGMETEESLSDDGGVDKTSGLSKRERLQDLKSKTKTKTKLLLKLGKPRDHDDTRHEDRLVDAISADPAFNPGSAMKNKRLSVGGFAEKALGTVQKVADTIPNPQKSFKSTVTKSTAGKLSQAHRPFLSKKTDAELLQARIDLEGPESSSSSRHYASDDERDRVEGSRRERVEELEAHRESLRVAWTTSRHIDRVRVVPKRHIDFPDRQAFVKKDAGHNVVRYDWGKWLGHVSATAVGPSFGSEAHAGSSTRRYYTTRRIFLLNILMTSMNFPLILIRLHTMLNV